jgi:dTDP-4-dehydrorhamnose 3,5-epimerase
MEVRETGIDGLVEIFPSLYHDERGWFYEFYKQESLLQLGIHTTFVQENQSFSKKGVIRGLHAQKAPYEQAKLVSVMQGRVLDVVVDIRPHSPTFKKVYQCILDAEKHNMLMIPEGFAHGFAALEDAVFFYKCSQSYHKESEFGIRWNDPSLNINWGVENPILSEKDLALPTLDELLIKSVFSPS